MSDHNTMRDWLHGAPVEVQEALSREIDTKDNPAYGELSKDGGAGQAMTTGAGWERVTGWNEPGLSHQVAVNGSDVITIITKGVYQVYLTLAMEVGDLGTYEIAVHVNDNIAHNLHASRDYNPNSIGNTALTGLVQLDKDDVLDLKLLVPGDTTITVEHASLIVLGLHQP